MIKNLTISTKITVLIIVVSLVAVTGISFFTYDYNLKMNEEKFNTNVSVIADHRAGYFNDYFDKIVSEIQILQNSEKLKGETGSTTPLLDAGGMAIMGNDLAG